MDQRRVSWTSFKSAFGKVEGALKLRYLGVGLVWAWLYCAYSTPALIAHREGHSINADGSWLASAIAVVVAFVAIGVALGRNNRAPRAREVVLGAGALAVGTALTGVGGPVLLWLGGVLTGLGYASLSILWAMALLRLDTEELELVIPLATLVVVPCVVVFPSLSGAPGVAATVLIPLASGFLLLLCLREERAKAVQSAARGAGGLADAAATDAAPASGSVGAAEDGAAPGGDSARGFAQVAGSMRKGCPDRSLTAYIARISLVLCVAYGVIGWQSALSEERDTVHALLSFDLSALVSNASTVLLAVALVFFSRKVSFSSLFRWVLPALIVSLVLFAQPGGAADFVPSVISATCDTLCQALVFLYAITLAKSRGVSVALCIGLVNGSLQAGVLWGNFLAVACDPVRGMLDAGRCGMALIGLVACATIVAPREEACPDAAVDASEESVETHRLLQERFGLSDREIEIALLLAQGRTRPYIREKLFISKNTVATHIKHIYAKLDIHSKEELIDLMAGLQGRL